MRDKPYLFAYCKYAFMCNHRMFPNKCIFINVELKIKKNRPRSAHESNLFVLQTWQSSQMYTGCMYLYFMVGACDWKQYVFLLCLLVQITVSLSSLDCWQWPGQTDLISICRGLQKRKSLISAKEHTNSTESNVRISLHDETPHILLPH